MKGPVYYIGSGSAPGNVFKRGHLGEWDRTGTQPAGTFWGGPPDTNNYQIWSDTFTRGSTNEENAKPVFWGTNNQNDEDLRQLIETIAEYHGAGPFATITDAFNWIDGRDDYYLENYTGFDPEAGLSLTRTDSSGYLNSPGSSERNGNIVMAGEVTFPATVDNGIIWEMGASGRGSWFGVRDDTTTPKLRFRAGNGGTSSPVGASGCAAVDILTFPTDGQSHTVVWEIRINPGRVRFWIDGNLEGEGNEPTNGPLSSNEWAGGDAGGFGQHGGGVCSGEHTTPWPLPMGSGLRVYAGQLVS